MRSIDDSVLQEWFCSHVLPLEPALTAFIRRNWREASRPYNGIYAGRNFVIGLRANF